MNEKEIFELIRTSILSIQEKKDKPIRIAVNGIEGTGKTVLAEKLTKYLNSENLNAIQVSIDGFHFNKEVRYKQGRNSAKGYYENSYNEIVFVEKVLKSSQTDSPNYTIATHNLETDEYLNLEPIKLENNSILITDGAYLFKANYRSHWDLKIYLKTSFEIAMKRGIERDKDSLGGVELAKEKYEKRYHESSRMYLTENEPEKIADIIIDNSDFNNLKVIKNITIYNKEAGK
jgi:uridine kinase